MPILLAIVSGYIFAATFVFGAELTAVESFAAMLTACACTFFAVVSYEYQLSKLEEKIEEAKIKNETPDKP